MFISGYFYQISSLFTASLKWPKYTAQYFIFTTCILKQKSEKIMFLKIEFSNKLTTKSFTDHQLQEANWLIFDSNW